MDKLKEFYTGPEWRALRMRLIAERRHPDGVLYCEYCHKPITKLYECIGHHKTELTEENVNNASIALNPRNVMLIHHQCHNLIHGKFNAGMERRVFIVYGPPLSGKTRYVRENALYGDLILDQDDIYQAISGEPRYIRPDSLKRVAFKVRQAIEEAILMRIGDWHNAYLIYGTYMTDIERNNLINKFNAELIEINATREECLSRLNNDPTREEVREEWAQYIDMFFQQKEIYERALPPASREEGP